jgi:hypothetical protein
VSYRVIKPPPNLDHGPRGGPPRAFCWHFAEGKNVASYLARNPARGVSVNFTIEQATSTFDDGEIIAMVPIDRISGSVNPNTLRTSDDPVGSLGRAEPTGRFGATEAKRLLGSGWRDPNRWIIGVELAGRGVDGPTPAQVTSMVRLVADMRKRYGSALRGNLGHRDFQQVKPCPNRHVPWDKLGGHGPFRSASEPTEEDYPVATLKYLEGQRQVCVVRKGADLYPVARVGATPIAETGEEREEDYLGTTEDGKFHLVSAKVDGVSRTAFISKGAMKGEPRIVAGDCPPEELTKARNTGWNEALGVAQGAVLAIKPREA